MKQIFKTTIFLLLALLLPATANAYDFEVDGIYYNITSPNTAQVTFKVYYGNIYSGNVNIPSTVTYSGTTYYVTSISNSAFEGCIDLTKVTIPNTVISIGIYAFSDCSDLTSINIPSSVKSIGEYAFSGCNSLDRVDISDLAAWCNITFQEINANPLCYAHHLYLNDFEVKELIIPTSISSIHAYAFSGCTGLTSISIPNSVESIGNWAFTYCSNLTKINIPNSVTSIGVEAFCRCSALTSITIPNTVTLIEHNTFLGCTSLSSISIGSSVTLIQGGAFTNCTSIADIYCYAPTPPVCDGFSNYTASLHVPATSLASYFTTPIWSNFDNLVGDAVAPTRISINIDSIGIQLGEQFELLATVTPTNASNQDVSWYSTNTTVAIVDNGIVTSTGNGECDIIATCFGLQAVCHVTVGEFLPSSVTLNIENATIEISSQLILTATILPNDATYEPISWSSSNISVASVDNNGVVTAVGTGECNITAYCCGKSAVCHVIVVEQFIYISLDQHEVAVLPNHIITLIPTVTPVSTDLVVTSSNPAIAAARLAGNKIQVVGVSEGQATIVVNSADGYAFADSCLVTVYTERGDVNGDGFVNIADVSAMIDYLLDSDASSVNTVNADANADNDVTIADVSMLIDYLLGNVELLPKDQNKSINQFKVNDELRSMGTILIQNRVPASSIAMGAGTPLLNSPVTDSHKQ